MIDKFIEYMKDESMSENTYLSYARDVKLFEKYYNDSYGEKMQNLTHSDISMYKSFLLKGGNSASTVNRKLAALKMYNRFLIDNNMQSSIVIKDKDYIKIQKPVIRKKIPTLKEVDKLKHFSSQDIKNAKRDYCIIVIFLYGGLRESELVNIKIADVKLSSRFINIIGKGNKFRQVIINNLMYDAIEDYLKERKEMNIKNPYLFIGQKNQNTKSPLSRNFCNRLLSKYQEICQMSNLHPHLLRAFFCSNALHNAKYSIDQVADQAGHSSLNTTKQYLSYEDEDLLTLANKL